MSRGATKKNGFPKVTLRIVAELQLGYNEWVSVNTKNIRTRGNLREDPGHLTDEGREAHQELQPDLSMSPTFPDSTACERKMCLGLP